MENDAIKKAFEGRWRVRVENVMTKHKEREPITYEVLRKYCFDFFEAGIILAHSTLATTVTEASPSGIVTDSSFDIFWNLYDKKVGKPKCEKLWSKLSQKDKKACLDYIPLYVSSQPDKQYRKNPETFLRNRAWEDELIPRYETTHTYQQHHGGVTSNEQVVRNTVDLIAEARQREDSGYSQEIWQP